MSDIKSACCFTGHRPSQLPWGYNEYGIRFKFFKFRLKRVIMKCIKQNYKHFISGMALGVDIIAAEIVLELKSHHPDITLECALPCKNQSEKWNDESILRYINVLSLADKVTLVSESLYFNGCMAKRNRYMINHSNRIIAIYNGKKHGGTYQTINMAKIANKEIVIIKP